MNQSHPQQLDYLADIERESARFHACLSTADPQAPVPSCPGWTSADLLWHLTEVQSFWTRVVRDGLVHDPDGPEVPMPEVDYATLLAGFSRATLELLGALTRVPDDTHVWTWSDDQSVGFVRRRQAHEALIHRLDAELTVGELTKIEPGLGADGVDEVLKIQVGGYPAWSTFTPGPGFGRITSTDTSDTWDIVIGNFSGTSPNTGNTYDEPTIEVADRTLPGEPDFVVAGTAAQLDAWMWQRKVLADPGITGSAESARPFIGLIEAGIQ